MSARKTTKQFIAEMKQLFPSQNYDYSKVEYTNNVTNVEIICPIHGSFYKTPNSILNTGVGCTSCFKGEHYTKLTKEQFLKQAEARFGNTYDYSKVEYTNKSTPVTLICPVHGEFEIKPSVHLQSKTGCQKCTGNVKKTTKEFVAEAEEIFPQYDYSEVEYVDCRTPVKVVCPTHGPFWINPKEHVGNRRQKCSICSWNDVRKRRLLSQEAWIEKVLVERPEFFDMFDYSFVDYTNDKTPVKIRCKTHDTVYKVQPRNHIKTKFGGCILCQQKAHVKRSFSTSKEFIDKSIEMFGEGSFDYSKVEYVDARTPVKLNCAIHDEWFESTPHNHFRSVKGSCPSCVSDTKTSSYEKAVQKILEKYEVQYIEQKTFDTCVYQKRLPFDFYLPVFNILIECQGRQHYEPVEHFGGVARYEIQQKRDQIKRDFCHKYSIMELEIPYWEFKDDNNVENIIKEALGI